ncbi:hypothetical protein J3R30DRAFT_3803695 [Lentinula aciculospora]|uniref:DUF6535 domain-containing protein n=1 Tax=Lentinula aciculospora TaxID=153920 RepID=A0A9W8ZZI7_9AGAR|nr:hypothetical protein J3R30DRAFT_3803695 [Lentinula aciculospora]
MAQPGNRDNAMLEMLDIVRDMRNMIRSQQASPFKFRVADTVSSSAPAATSLGDMSPPPVTRAATNPSTGGKTPFKPRWFGLKKERERMTQIHSMEANYDYRVKYPKDQRYHELDEEARVWWVYLDEATNFDNDMVGELSDSLDILLVFAGLFSAVLTTFVAQTSQALSQDYTQLSSSYLAEVTMLLRANGNGTTIPSIGVINTAFSPAINDLWLNGLWFTSLVLSLSVALFAVLAKQWMRQYMSIITGTPVERVFIRQYRFNGFKKWHVQAIIGILPVMLHLALVLFLLGLVIFLIPLNVVMACIIGAITAVVIILYVAASCTPLFIVQCAYRTTFTDLLYYICQVFRGVYLWLVYPIREYRFRHFNPDLPSEQGPEKFKPIVALREVERLTACDYRSDSDNESMKFESLWWLGQSTTSPSAKEIIRHSLGAFSRNMSEAMSTHAAFPVLYGYRALIDMLFEYKDQFDQLDVQNSEQMDYLEAQVRACVNHSGCRRNFHQLNFASRIPVSDLSIALTLLSSGILEVPIEYLGKTTILERDSVLPWILNVYRQSNFDRESEIKLPLVIWNALLDWYREKVGMNHLSQTFKDYLQTHSLYTQGSAHQATQYLSDVVHIRQREIE